MLLIRLRSHLWKSELNMPLSLSYFENSVFSRKFTRIFSFEFCNYWAIFKQWFIYRDSKRACVEYNQLIFSWLVTVGNQGYRYQSRNLNSLNNPTKNFSEIFCPVKTASIILNKLLWIVKKGPFKNYIRFKNEIFDVSNQKVSWKIDVNMGQALKIFT